MDTVFKPFPKIARLSREVIVTEKIDGTNCGIHIYKDGDFRTTSRNRFATPEDDHFGFSRWAHDNKDDLMALGPGSHFGEWWGKGINRGYNLDERRFSLFNVHRWHRRGDGIVSTSGIAGPKCCHVVPLLGRFIFSTEAITRVMECLAGFGSAAAPDFMKPEGIVVYHSASNTLFKKTFEKDEEGKGNSPA